MTITSKYDGVCKVCGGKIRRGEQIEWTRDGGARHLECPAEPEAAEPSYGQVFVARRGGEPCGDCGHPIAPGERVQYRYPGKVLCHADCGPAERKAAERQAAEAEAPYRLSGGEGYGCEGWREGQTLRSSERQQAEGWPEYVTVVSASSRYVREDGMSFGVGDDQGYVYSARARAATEEEAAPVRELIAQAEARKAAAGRLQELARQVQETGEYPDPTAGQQNLDGERLLDTQTIYGGGDWWVIGNGSIWYVRNNGADGDCWAHSNVATGGAGAIGWRVPRTEELEAELRELAETLAR